MSGTSNESNGWAEEKAKNLKSKMEAFSAVIAEKGTPENLIDIKALINEL